MEHGFFTVDVLQRSSNESRLRYMGQPRATYATPDEKIMGHAPIVATFTRAIERVCQATVATRPACFTA